MTLYASKAGPNTSSPLYTINPTTGAATVVASMSVALTGMAFDPTTSIMYGVTSPSSNNPRRLVTVNLSTAATTIIGELLDGTDSHICADIAFDSSGQLYGWSQFSDSLVTIDKTTGAVTPTANVQSSYGDGMDFDWEDKLYGIFDGDDGTLWQVDTSDGTLTTIAGLHGDGDAVPAGAMQDDKFYILVNVSPTVFLASVNYYGVISTIGQTLDRMDALATDDPGGRSDWHGVSPYPFVESWEDGSINIGKWTIYRQYGTSPLDPNNAESWASITTDEAVIDTHSVVLSYIHPTATNYDKQQTRTLG